MYLCLYISEQIRKKRSKINNIYIYIKYICMKTQVDNSNTYNNKIVSNKQRNIARKITLLTVFDNLDESTISFRSFLRL